MVRIILKGERPKSWNKYWAGVHWRKRKADRDMAHMTVREAIDPDKTFIFEVPVEITVNVWFKNRPLDVWNVVTKPYIDALIGWYIVDDSMEYVPTAHTNVYIDKKNPRLEIEIKPVELAPF